jgi:hypothetical protein
MGILWLNMPGRLWDGELHGPIQTRRVQPYEARKDYVCPGCHQTIPTGMGHIVAIFVATGMPHVGRVALRARKSELKEVFKHFKSRTQHCCRIETET